MKDIFIIDKTFIRYLALIFTILVIDHLIKVIVYSNLELHEGINIFGDWFIIQLSLNDGTAFAIPFKSEFDRYLKIGVKLLLTVILLVTILYFLHKKSPKILIIGLALCFAGTLGNLIDRIFYGVLLNNALEIYSIKWFHGRIIDMFSIQLFDINTPNWFPMIGGNKYIIFEPIFNFADLILVIGGIFSAIGLVKNKGNKTFIKKSILTK